MGDLNCCQGKNDNNSTLNIQNEIKKIEENQNINNINYENLNTENTQNILNTMRSNNQYFINQYFDKDFFNFLKSNSIDEISTLDFENYIPEKIKETIKANDDNDLYIQDNPFFNKYYYNQNEKKIKCFLLKKRSSIYKGDWVKNSLNLYSFSGKGIYYSLTENYLLDGIWNGNKLIFGRIHFITGQVYEGPIINNKANGIGRFIDSKGINYFGNFIDNKMTGEGLIKFPNSTLSINGIFDSNENITGHNIEVIFISIDKEYKFEYKGGVKENILNGFGTLSSDNFGKYTGNFYNNLYNGNGQIHYSNNIIFEGNFRDGNMISGIFNFPDKSFLNAKFNNGKIEGHITFIDKDGNENLCEFKNGNYIEGSISDKSEENEKVLKENINIINSYKMFTNNFLNYFGLGYFYKNNGIIYTCYGNKIEKLSHYLKNIDFNL